MAMISIIFIKDNGKKGFKAEQARVSGIIVVKKRLRLYTSANTKMAKSMVLDSIEWRGQLIKESGHRVKC